MGVEAIMKTCTDAWALSLLIVSLQPALQRLGQAEVSSWNQQCSYFQSTYSIIISMRSDFADCLRTEIYDKLIGNRCIVGEAPLCYKPPVPWRCRWVLLKRISGANCSKSCSISG